MPAYSLESMVFGSKNYGYRNKNYNVTHLVSMINNINLFLHRLSVSTMVASRVSNELFLSKAMDLVAEKGIVTQTDLKECIGDQGRIRRLMEVLEAQGLIEVSYTTKGKLIMLYSLTDKGKLWQKLARVQRYLESEQGDSEKIQQVSAKLDQILAELR